MTTVCHTWAYGRFIEIGSYLRRKTLLAGSFTNRDNTEPHFNLEEKVNPSILKNDFFSKTDLSIFTSIEPLSNEKTKPVEFSQH